MSTKKNFQLSVENLLPTPGYLLVKPAPVETQTVSGIYLPDSHGEKPQYGSVLATGESTFVGDQKINSPAKVGDQVVYKKWGGNEIKIKETEYQFLKFEDILAVIK